MESPLTNGEAAQLTIRRILCPVDLSETSHHAIEHAVAISRWFRASVSVLHVYSPMFMPIPSLPAVEDRVSESELGRVRVEVGALCAAAGAADVDVLVEVGAPARLIVERAADLPADLIVMGTHGAGGFERLVLGSVTEKVLRKAGCPVLTVPPRAHATSTLPFKQLLCAVDFSDSSLAGLKLACLLAGESKSQLTLLHVIEWPWEEPPAPVFAELPSEQAAALAEYRRYVEKGATERLKGLARDLTCGQQVPAVRVVHGNAHVEILRVAGELTADLIVMGVHGRNAADLLLFGSTTHQIVRRASCPVLTLRR
jgi:nucleotide-binding universal stress UspA family protein